MYTGICTKYKKLYKTGTASTDVYPVWLFLLKGWNTWSDPEQMKDLFFLLYSSYYTKFTDTHGVSMHEQPQ